MQGRLSCTGGQIQSLAALTTKAQSSLLQMFCKCTESNELCSAPSSHSSSGHVSWNPCYGTRSRFFDPSSLTSSLSPHPGLGSAKEELWPQHSDNVWFLRLHADTLSGSNQKHKIFRQHYGNYFDVYQTREQPAAEDSLPLPGSLCLCLSNNSSMLLTQIENKDLLRFLFFPMESNFSLFIYASDRVNHRGSNLRKNRWTRVKP